jgi:hypothetical protein
MLDAKTNDGAPILTSGKQGTGNALEILESQENKYPHLCRSCRKQFSVFECEGHPDHGEKFACGLMVEAMEARDRQGGCCHRIVDFEKFQKNLLPAILKRGRVASHDKAGKIGVSCQIYAHNFVIVEEACGVP